MENQRVRLSKSMLKTALIDLLQEKPVNKISVYELCQKAELNRGTFYKYYGSPYELLEEIEREFFEKVEESLQGIDPTEPEALLTVLNYLKDQHKTVTILAYALSDEALSDHLFQIPMVRELFREGVEAGYSEKEARYRRLFIFRGAYAILREWLAADEPEPAEWIADVMLSLTQFTIGTYHKKEN